MLLRAFVKTPLRPFARSKWVRRNALCSWHPATPAGYLAPSAASVRLLAGVAENDGGSGEQAIFPPSRNMNGMKRRDKSDTTETFEFLRLLWRVNHALERRSKHMHAQLGITGPQRMVVRFVGRAPGISAGELARTLHLDPGTLTPTFRALESQRLLVRTRDTNDRRRVLLHLTARGRRLDTETPRTVESAVRRVIAGRSAGSLEHTRQTLEALATALGDEGDAEVKPW